MGVKLFRVVLYYAHTTHPHSNSSFSLMFFIRNKFTNSFVECNRGLAVQGRLVFLSVCSLGFQVIAKLFSSGRFARLFFAMLVSFNCIAWARLCVYVQCQEQGHSTVHSLGLGQQHYAMFELYTRNETNATRSFFGFFVTVKFEEKIVARKFLKASRWYTCPNVARKLQVGGIIQFFILAIFIVIQNTCFFSRIHVAIGWNKCPPLAFGKMQDVRFFSKVVFVFNGKLVCSGGRKVGRQVVGWLLLKNKFEREERVQRKKNFLSVSLLRINKQKERKSQQILYTFGVYRRIVFGWVCSRTLKLDMCASKTQTHTFLRNSFRFVSFRFFLLVEIRPNPFSIMYCFSFCQKHISAKEQQVVIANIIKWINFKRKL